MNIEEFKIVSEFGVEKFNQEVKNFLSQDWEPYGELSIVTEHSKVKGKDALLILYTQAFVRTQ